MTKSVLFDVVSRQGVREGAKLTEEAETAIGTKEFLCHVSAGIGSYLAGLLITKVGMWSWIASVLAMMAGGYLLIWRVRLCSPRELCKDPEEGSNTKPRHLYLIALPYLGIALANSAFSTFLQLDIGVLTAGLVLLINRFATAFTNLLANKWHQYKDGRHIFQWSIASPVVGILLISLGNLFPTGISLPLLHRGRHSDR